MKAFRTSAAVLALTSGLLALSAQAEVVQQNASGDPLYTVEAPKGYAMFGDLVIARPLLIGATALGTAAFIVSLPFTALGLSLIHIWQQDVGHRHHGGERGVEHLEGLADQADTHERGIDHPVEMCIRDRAIAG